MFGGLAAVQVVEGKGLGIVAIQSISRGQRVLSEAPVFMVQRNEYATWEEQLEQFRNTGDVPEPFEMQLTAKLEERSSQEQEAFWALCDSHAAKEKSACGTWLSNSLSMGAHLQDTGVLAVGSRFNHSCTPNVCYSWQEAFGTYIFHAAHRVEAGDELTISYVSPLRPYSLRSGMLVSRYKFLCCCSCCSLVGSARAASDERRQQMYILDRQISSLLASPPTEQQVVSAMQVISLLIGLIDEEMGGNPKLKARAYYVGLQISMAVECADEAQDMLDKMQEQSLMTVGEDGDIFSCLGIVDASGEEGSSEAESRAQVSLNVGNCEAKVVELKRRFKALPGRGGDVIDAQGLQELLQQGRPETTQKEALALFNLVSKDADGKIRFGELVDLLYSNA